MLLLALDTSTSAVTVALHDGADVLAELTDLAGAPRHAEVLAPATLRETIAVLARDTAALYSAPGRKATSKS